MALASLLMLLVKPHDQHHYGEHLSSTPFCLKNTTNPCVAHVDTVLGKKSHSSIMFTCVILPVSITKVLIVPVYSPFHNKIAKTMFEGKDY